MKNPSGFSISCSILIFRCQFFQDLLIFLLTFLVSLQIGLVRFNLVIPNCLCLFCIGRHFKYFLSISLNFTIKNYLEALSALALSLSLFFLRRRLLSISRRLSIFLCFAIQPDLLPHEYPFVRQFR